MEESNEIEKWKLKHMIKKLNNMRGEGTSVISFFIAPNSQISDAIGLLSHEVGVSANIKSHTNKLSVISAIQSGINKLKLFPKVPANGLVLYSGNVLVNGKERKVTEVIEPYKPLKLSKYRCDSKFITEPLEDLLTDDQKYGFIIMDGNGALFGRVQGSSKEVLTKFGVDLPKKQKKGGQSAPRFQRLRLIARDGYVKKVGETATQVFITNNLINVDGLFLAGSADFKNDLKTSAFLDQRIKSKVLGTVDISYGGNSGFDEALEAVKDELPKFDLMKEKEILNRFFLEMRQDTKKYIYGPQQTIDAMLAGAVEDLILDENLALFYAEENEILSPHETENSTLFTEWITLNYKKYGCRIHFVTASTGEGTQFVRGFGGIAGILKYQYETSQIVEEQKPREQVQEQVQEQQQPGGEYNFTEDDFM